MYHRVGIEEQARDHNFLGLIHGGLGCHAQSLREGVKPGDTRPQRGAALIDCVKGE